MAGGTITLELGWPSPKLSPNSRCHFMEQYRFKKASKDTAYWATKAALGRDKFEATGEIPVHITASPPDKRSRDQDNLLASLKSHLDGIALALGVDDKHFRPSLEWADPVPNGKLVVRVG